MRKGVKSMETVTEIPVRYAETDQMGVVYHSNYLIWLEVARTHFLEELGFPYIAMEKAGCISPVIDCELHYGAPFTYGDVVCVYTRVTKVTPVRTEYSYRLFLKGEDPESCKPRFTGSTVHCVVDKDTFKPVSQKREFPDLFEAYKRVVTE